MFRDIEVLRENFIEYIYEETGINLSDQDVIIKCEGHSLSADIFGLTVVNTEFDEDEITSYSAEDFAVILGEKIGNAKRVLTDLKIAQLEKFLPAVMDRIKKELSVKLPADFADDFVFSVEDRGYKYTHYAFGQEAESGFPVIVLNITGLKGFEMDYPLNIYYPETPVDDLTQIIEDIIDYFNKDD